MTDAKRTKSVDVSIEIDAEPEAVWRALSEGDGIGRWFALHAEVEPGIDGKYRIDWGPDCAGQGTITAWEECRRLRYNEEWPGAELEVPVAVEYTIERRGDRTVVRMVNSGFSADADWADYLDTIDSGWRYFLSNLKFYLERHDGTPRRMVWSRRKIAVPKAQAWARILGHDGLAAVSAPTQPAAPVTLWSGCAGVTTLVNAPIHYAAHFEGLNDALLFIELEPGEGEYSLGVWLSLYGVDESRAAELDASLATRLDGLFPEPVAAEVTS